MSPRNVNFPLRSVKHGAMNAYVEIEVQRSTFVASALNGDEGTAACLPAPLNPLENVYPQNKKRIWHERLSVENKNFSFLWPFQ